MDLSDEFQYCIKSSWGKELCLAVIYYSQSSTHGLEEVVILLAKNATSSS